MNYYFIYLVSTKTKSSIKDFLFYSSVLYNFPLRDLCLLQGGKYAQNALDKAECDNYRGCFLFTGQTNPAV